MYHLLFIPFKHIDGTVREKDTHAMIYYGIYAKDCIAGKNKWGLIGIEDIMDLVYSGILGSIWEAFRSHARTF